MSPRIFLAWIVAIICFSLALAYATGKLQFGASHPGPHELHALVFLVLGLLALAWLRFENARVAR